MSHIRLGLLGLCVSGLMAFGATGAQAEVGAKWLILTSGGVLKTGAELHASINLKTDATMIFHSEILKIKSLFLCTTIELLNAKLQEEGIIGNTVVTNETTKLKEGRGSQIKFSGCTTDLNGTVSPACTPEDPVGGKGTVISKLGHGLLKLHELAIDKVKDDIIKVLPDTGETFATINTGPAVGNECPIGTSVPVIGSLVFRDCENLALTHLVEHLLEGFTPLTEMWTISKTTEHKSMALGSAWAFLTGEHVGLKWSGDPA
jgi:hypothetical protein